MEKRGKIVLWAAGTLGTLLVLLIAAALLAPSFINLEAAKEGILRDLSRDLRGEVHLGQAELSFFPWPRVLIRQSSVSIPGGVSATIDVLTVFPAILPLAVGEVRIVGVKLTAPKVTVQLPQPTAALTGKAVGFLPAGLKEKAAFALGLMAAKAPGVEVRVEQGSLSLLAEGQAVFWFTDVEAKVELPPQQLNLTFSCTSNLWEGLRLTGWIDPRDFKGKGHLKLAGFRPLLLANHLLPQAGSPVRDLLANLDLTFDIETLEKLNAEVQGSIPLCIIGEGTETMIVKAQDLAATFLSDADRISATLAKLDLESPGLLLAGKYLSDAKAGLVSLEIEARNVDVDSTRDAALLLAGQFEITRKIFEVLRGGKAELITISAQGKSPADLKEPDNMVIKGNMTQGRIFVPKVMLDLTDVQGEVSISQGILEGKNLKASFGASQGREGTLRLGLKEGDDPFHLELVIAADLSQLPPILARVVRNEPFARQIKLIKELKGNALGRLILGESLQAVETRLDVSELNVRVRHERLPFPVEIDRGRLHLDPVLVVFDDLDARLGKSVISGLHARLDLAKEYALDLLSRKAAFQVDEILPWLLSFDTPKGLFKEVKSGRGTIMLNPLDLTGPLFSPQEWRFAMTGSIAAISLETTLFPGPLGVSRGEFAADQSALSFSDAQTRLLDASITTSGSLAGYLSGLKGIKLAFHGNLGANAMQWAENLLHLPSQFALRPPLTVSEARLDWKPQNAETSIIADLTMGNGLVVSVDIRHTPEELAIKKLNLQDQASRAAIALILGKDKLHLDFKGELTEGIVNRALVNNRFLHGTISGDFTAHILPDLPMNSSVQGKLFMQGLDPFWQPRTPIKMESISLTGSGARLDVDIAKLAWGEDRLTLGGGITFSPEGFLLDMNLAANSLDWDKIKTVFAPDDRAGQPAADPGASPEGRRAGLQSLPLRGVLKVKAEAFKYDRFILNPFDADVLLDRDGMIVEITRAELCGVSIPARLTMSPPAFELYITPVANKQALAPTLSCLGNKSGLMDGLFDLKSELTTNGRGENPLGSINGPVTFAAQNGRIYRFGLMAKIFSVLNVTEIYKGTLPDLMNEGFAYDSIKVLGNIENGRLILKESFVDSPTMKMVWMGQVNLVDQKADLTVLVAPLKTVDRIISHLPILGDILGGRLISIPMRVTGDLTDPTVIPLSPTAVGNELLEMMKRTLKVPFKLFQPLLPGNDK